MPILETDELVLNPIFGALDDGEGALAGMMGQGVARFLEVGLQGSNPRDHLQGSNPGDHCHMAGRPRYGR